MRENQRRAGLRASCGHEELAVYFEAVFALEHHLLGYDELRGREVGRQRRSGNHLSASLGGDAIRHRGNRGGRTETCEVVALTGFDWCPLHASRLL